jgi:hypothetical protein
LGGRAEKRCNALLCRPDGKPCDNQASDEEALQVAQYRPREFKADGSLLLVQRVEDEGKPVHERRWQIREIDQANSPEPCPKRRGR